MRDDYLEDYYSFLRFPSVSTDEKYAGKVRECAQWLSKKLATVGLESKVVPTAGHPIVWARNEHKKNRPTVCFTVTMTFSRQTRWNSGNRRRSNRF
jgi:acetylornithine deacetylase/succinyl-diaminopimelate desuccinylase-like protein